MSFFQVTLDSEKGWRCYESTRLSPMWPRFDSVLDIMHGLSLLVLYSALQGFSRVLQFPLSPKKPLDFDLIWFRFD